MTADDYRKLFYWEGAFEKIVFGTDVRIEHLNRAKQVYNEIMDLLDLTQDIRDKIFGQTMARILGIDT